jgi:hypothetical protein
VAFRENEHVGTRIAQVFAAQWLAYVLPCRRFAATLAGDSARLGAGADRYSFTVVDLHLLLLAGFTGAPKFLTFEWPRAWHAKDCHQSRFVTAQVVNQVAPAKHGRRWVAPELGDEFGLT